MNTNNRTRDEVVFETTASSAVLVAAAVLAALLYRLITEAAPLLESLARAQALQ